MEDEGAQRRQQIRLLSTYTSFGNAFQQLQMLAEPQTGYVIEEKVADNAEEDDDGELEDEADLTRQFRQIRNGDRSAQPVVCKAARRRSRRSSQ